MVVLEGSCSGIVASMAHMRMTHMVKTPKTCILCIADSVPIGLGSRLEIGGRDAETCIDTSGYSLSFLFVHTRDYEVTINSRNGCTPVFVISTTSDSSAWMETSHPQPLARSLGRCEHWHYLGLIPNIRCTYTDSTRHHTMCMTAE